MRARLQLPRRHFPPPGRCLAFTCTQARDRCLTRAGRERFGLLEQSACMCCSSTNPPFPSCSAKHAWRALPAKCCPRLDIVVGCLIRAYALLGYLAGTGRMRTKLPWNVKLLLR